MSHEVIETYIADTLKPQLFSLNITNKIIDNITNSVREQMVSCIYHWNDVDFRSAILVTGEEEGAFYLPKAEADVRNFVVATVRNSPLESIHADSYHPIGQGRRLTPDDIKALTSAAIGYFSKVDFPKTAEEISAPEHDMYGDLAQRYPASWDALASLAYATSSEPIVEYEPIQFDKLPNLNNLRRRHAVGGMLFNENKSQFMHVTDDGYSLTIDFGLAHILQTVIENKVPFVGDSFKGISRNMEKLLTIMEFVMGNNLWVVTTNYFIVNGHVERRTKLLKPGHDHAEMKRNFLNGTGITKHHRIWLKSAAEA